jgi:hypothetical protein
MTPSSSAPSATGKSRCWSAREVNGTSRQAHSAGAIYSPRPLLRPPAART